MSGRWAYLMWRLISKFDVMVRFRNLRDVVCTSLSFFLYVVAQGPAVILRAFSCLDTGPETGRLKHVRFCALLLFFYLYG